MTERTETTDRNLDQMLKLALSKAIDEVIAKEPPARIETTQRRGRRHPIYRRWSWTS